MLNLDKNDFDFWMVKWLKALILVGFDDMGYDKGFEVEKLGFCLVLFGFVWFCLEFEIVNKIIYF